MSEEAEIAAGMSREADERAVVIGKKIDRCAVNGKAQQAAEARSDARRDIRSLLEVLSCQLNELNDLDDDPEGRVTVSITMSATLARRMENSLCRALSQL